MYEDLIDLGKEYYIWLKKEKKDRQQFVYPLPQHLTKNHFFILNIKKVQLKAALFNPIYICVNYLPK